jgi:hypothetical protein
MQASAEFFGYFNITRLVPIVAIALVCASAGGMLTWLAGPSKTAPSTSPAPASPTAKAS